MAAWFYVDRNTNEIIQRDSGIPVENPTVLFDADTGTVHGVGSYKPLEQRFKTIMARLGKVGAKWNLVLMQLSDILTLDEKCYILCRCIGYTSLFPVELYRHFEDGNVLEWLKQEMARIEIAEGE